MSKYHPEEIVLFLIYLVAFMSPSLYLVLAFLPLCFKVISFGLNDSWFVFIIFFALSTGFFARFLFLIIFLSLGIVSQWKVEIFFRIAGLLDEKGNFIKKNAS